MILSDFHTHSSNSGDSDTPMKLQIDAAIKAGITELCITEHMDMGYPDPPKDHEDEMCDFVLDADRYHKEYTDMKALYEKEPNINIYFGVELGLQDFIVAENAEFASKYPFDFIIASSHLFDRIDPYFPEYWEGKSETAMIRRYFESIYENICLFSNFDVYGHLDYLVRYMKDKDKNYDYKSYSDEIDTILKKLIEMGKGIEINTGGLKNGLMNPNPCPGIIKRYKELGGEIITVGSDAHTPDYIGYRFDVAEEILKDCGFKYYTVFKSRKPEFIKI